MGRSIEKSVEAKKQVIDREQSNGDDYTSAIQSAMHGVSDVTRIVYLHGEVNEQSIGIVISQMLFLAQQNSQVPIYLIVSTYGGSVDEMFSLYDIIKFLPCPVHTIALGKVMSAGVLLLASGVKGKRLIGKSARIMIHPISSLVGGNVFQVMNESNEIKRLHDLMLDALLVETKMPKKKVEEIMGKGSDHYLTPKDAVTLGIVDKII